MDCVSGMTRSEYFILLCRRNVSYEKENYYGDLRDNFHIAFSVVFRNFHARNTCMSVVAYR